MVVPVAAVVALLAVVAEAVLVVALLVASEVVPRSLL